MSIGKVIGNVLRFLFAWVDSVVAKVITEVYNVLINLSELILYSDNIVKTIGKRIGLLLGIFMLFRLAISLINYMISPDKSKDNSKGGAKLVTNIVVSLVLLSTINVIFEQAYKIQITLVKSNIIGKIFFGESDTPNMDVGYYLYSSFFTPNSNPDILGDSCKDIWDPTIKYLGTECFSKIEQYTENETAMIIENARKDMQMSKIFYKYRLVLAMDSSKDEFVFNYIPILSTVAGVITLFILISFSMELATRAVKLLFLQIIAPIPIIFNMDLGKGKDVFQKWYKDCFSTYISVFLRLLAINFVVFMLVLLKGNFKSSFDGNWLLNVFLIIGCLIFAKRVPKLLEDMMGIKMDGMSLHPFKKFQEQALFGKQIGGFASNTLKGTAGALGGAAAGFRAGGRVDNRLGGTLAGAVMGAHIGKHDKKPLTSSANGVYKNLVGTDFVNFSFTKWALGGNGRGEARVKQVKDARTFASGILNEYNTRLRSSEALTAELTSALSQAGFDVSKLADFRASAQYVESNSSRYAESKQKLEQRMAEYQNARSEFNRISEQLKEAEEAYSKNPSDSAAEERLRNLTEQQTSLSSKMSHINSETAALSSFVREYESKRESVDAFSDVRDKIERYSDTLAEQDELRSRIAVVQKDIDDLSSEKSQRERFYGYDPSPSDDIRKIRKATESEDAYKARVDEKIGKSNN